MSQTADFGSAFSAISNELCDAATEQIASLRKEAEVGKSGPNLQGSGSVDFKLVTDGAGKAAASISKYGAGKTLSCVAYVSSPQGPTLYSGTVKSSDGGGTEFHNIKVKQPISFQLQTSFWHSTMFSVALTTSPPLPEKTEVVVHLDYSY
jgi:hypothetical protein